MPKTDLKIPMSQKIYLGDYLGTRNNATSVNNKAMRDPDIYSISKVCRAVADEEPAGAFEECSNDSSRLVL
jgi:hypothetical protein